MKQKVMGPGAWPGTYAKRKVGRLNLYRNTEMNDLYVHLYIHMMATIIIRCYI